MVQTDETVGNPTVRLCEIVHDAGSCGFNLSKSKWDPYPWVSTVEADSPAATAGVLPGDCLLEVNGEDMLGLRVVEVAARIRARGDRATVMLWNAGIDPSCSSETLCCGPMPMNLQRLTTCMSNILEALECPICLETIPPPAHQCANGHLICVCCRARTERCPVCRMRFFRGRSLLADQVFDSLIDAFDLRQENEADRSKLLLQKVYGPRKNQKKHKPEIKINFLSPTNKFLTRIMGSGKSTSVENLAAGPNHGFDSPLKTKSLSSSEIFQDDPQLPSRASSILSSRPGSGLLGVNTTLGTRPASYHGSAEDLRSRIITDFQLDIAAPKRMATCPLAPTCTAQMSVSEIKRHLQQHEHPIINFYRPEIELPLAWLDNAIVVIECFNRIFFVRAIPSQHLWVCALNQSRSEYSTTACITGSQCEFSVLPLIELNVNEISDCGVSLKNTDTNAKITITINECT